jgi:ankyrin repeat protein
LLPLTEKRPCFYYVESNPWEEPYEGKEITITPKPLPWYTPLLVDGIYLHNIRERLSLLLETEGQIDLNVIKESKGDTLLGRFFLSFARKKVFDEKAFDDLQWLIAQGADPKNPSGCEEQSALHLFAKTVQIENKNNLVGRVIDFLLECGVDENARDASQCTALELAKRVKNRPAIAHLENRKQKL